MKTSIRNKVYEKYNGRCAYTGKLLDDKWQVDHMNPKSNYTTYGYYFENIDTKEKISTELYFSEKNNDNNHFLWEYKVVRIFDSKSANSIDNLVPSLRIVNHYKRDLDLEQFRDYMLTFHNRLSKLPKKTCVERTKRRIEYMNEIASLFNISVDKPFNGTFYFENLR